MGSGYWPIGDGKPDLATCRIGFVRGPLTARELRLNEELAIIDPAVLVSEIVSCSSQHDEQVGFMPHHLTYNTFNCDKIANLAGVRLIDPTAPVLNVLNAIMQSPMILAEAMHGAIVADAMGIPWQNG